MSTRCSIKWRNLLARIHGDSGHYVAQHGLEKAMEDADQLCAKWRSQQAEAQEPCAFIGLDESGQVRIWMLPSVKLSLSKPDPSPLFTRPQPAQIERLSEEEVKAIYEQACNESGASFKSIASMTQSALAAKNGAVLV